MCDAFAKMFRLVKAVWFRRDDLLNRELPRPNLDLEPPRPNLELTIGENARLAEMEFLIGEPVKLLKVVPLEAAARLDATLAFAPEFTLGARAAADPELLNECQPLDFGELASPCGAGALACVSCPVDGAPAPRAAELPADPELPNVCQPLEFGELGSCPACGAPAPRAIELPAPPPVGELYAPPGEPNRPLDVAGGATVLPPFPIR